MFSNVTNSLIAGGTYYQVTGLPKEFDVLHQHIAVGALHDSAERFNPPRCLPETRGAILSEIMEWVTRTNRETYLLWLYGMVGTGKSALAQSIAEQCHARELLAASFFFSRKFEQRSHEKRLAATIAYQLAVSIPEVRGAIEAAIHQDPSVFDRAFQTQFQRLIIRPLLSVIEASERQIRPQLVLIDGLDECYDHKVQCYILNVINEEFQRSRHFPLLFIITSRPEEHIRMTFSAGGLARLSLRISLEDYFSLHDDVQIFLLKKFSEIKENHPLRAFIPATWPSQNIIETLVLKSSGQFAYAATVADYVSSIQHRPTDRLDVVLGISLPDSDAPFSELDALYKHIFSAVTNLRKTLRILGAILFMDLGISPAMLEQFLSLKPGDVYLHLSPLASIITFQDHHQVLKVQHPSLTDFLLDFDRSEEFHLEARDVHADIAACSLRHLRVLEVPVLVDYACYNFELHFEKANPSQVLHNELLTFQLGSLHINCQNHNSQTQSSEPILTLEDVWYYTPVFFTCLENSLIFEDMQAIHERHLESFDCYLEAEIDKYLVDDRLIDLITMLTVYHSPITVHNLDDVHLCKDLILQLDARAEHLIMIDENSLNLRLMIRRHAQSEPYIELLCRFLEDPHRSGDHFINGIKYARAAYRCASWISEHSFNSSDELTLKALMWNLECIPPLLLRATYDEELWSFLKDFTIKTTPHLNRNSYYPMFVRTVREVRLAYLISVYLEMDKSSDIPDARIHARLDVVPQGLRIYLLEKSGNGPFAKFDDYLDNDAAEIVTKACCCRCLIAEYFIAKSEGDAHLEDQTYIIIHIEDPFPELDSISTKRWAMEDLKVTVPRVMQILAYKTWRKLMQDVSESD